jgi:hypothetical protein
VIDATTVWGFTRSGEQAIGGGRLILNRMGFCYYQSLRHTLIAIHDCRRKALFLRLREEKNTFKQYKLRANSISQKGSVIHLTYLTAHELRLYGASVVQSALVSIAPTSAMSLAVLRCLPLLCFRRGFGADATF